MSIQSNINQGLSLMGLMFSQTGMADIGREKAAEKAAQRAKEKQIQKDIDEYEKMADYGIEPETEAEAAVQIEIAKKGQAAYKQAFEQNPTAKTYGRYQASEEDVAYLEQQKEGIAAQKKTAIQKQREAAQKAKESLAADQERLAQFRKQMLGGQAQTHNVREVIKYGKE